MFIETKIDLLLKTLLKNNSLDFLEASKTLSWGSDGLEKSARILEDAKIVEIKYYLNPFQKPAIFLKSKELVLNPSSSENSPKEKERYDLKPEGKTLATVSINYSNSEKHLFYDINIATVSYYTQLYFNAIKDELARTYPIQLADMAQNDLQTTVMLEKISKKIADDGVAKSDQDIALISDVLIHQMFGLGVIDSLMQDAWLEEVIINTAKLPISVYHRKYGWLKTNLTIKTEDEILNYATQIARKVGREVTTLNPILDAHLKGGDRVNATIKPIASKGHSINIRMFARNPWTIISLIDESQKSMSVEMASLLWQAMQYEMNIMVAWGTASGKTSMLNALVSLIQPYQRVVTIEDSRELNLPSYQWNWVPMVTRRPNPEGLGEVTMLDLLINSLRMRPDRIVLGEVRKKEEAQVLFEAMHTGHSTYSTIHADTGEEVLKRLMQPPFEVSPILLEDINLIVAQFRDRRKNIRRTLQILEVKEGEKTPEINHIHVWRPRKDIFQAVNSPRKYIESLNLHTGMTEKEINQDQLDKGEVLSWMLKNGVSSVEDVGKVMKLYYAEPDFIVNSAKKNLLAKKVLEE